MKKKASMRHPAPKKITATCCLEDSNCRLHLTGLDMLEFLENARTLAIAGNKDEVFAELRGDYCKDMLARA